MQRSICRYYHDYAILIPDIITCSEQHSKDMRASIRESLAQAQRLCVRKELLHEALLTADKERHHKVFVCMYAHERAWWCEFVG